MTLEEFRTLAETWGGDVERWPEARRTAGRVLAARPEAAAILAEARRLDERLARRPDVSPERAQRAAHAVALKLAAQSAETKGVWSLLFPRQWLMPAASLACSVIIGVSLGVALPYPRAERDQGMVLGVILDSTSIAGGLEVR